jgi:hypothetical protein
VTVLSISESFGGGETQTRPRFGVWLRSNHLLSDLGAITVGTTTSLRNRGIIRSCSLRSRISAHQRGSADLM